MLLSDRFTVNSALPAASSTLASPMLTVGTAFAMSANESVSSRRILSIPGKRSSRRITDAGKLTASPLINHRRFAAGALRSFRKASSPLWLAVAFCLSSVTILRRRTERSLSLNRRILAFSARVMMTGKPSSAFAASSAGRNLGPTTSANALTPPTMQYASRIPRTTLMRVLFIGLGRQALPFVIIYLSSITTRFKVTN